MGYSILCFLTLCIGTAIGLATPLEKFYELDKQCAKLEREKEDLSAQLREIRVGTALSMRLLRTLHCAAEDTDSSGTDV